MTKAIDFSHWLLLTGVWAMSTDEQAIRGLLAAWFAATAAGDLDRLLTLMAEDVVFLTAGRPPLGRAAFAEGFRAGRQRQRVEAGGELEEVVVSGDLAHGRVRLSVTVTPLAAGNPPQR